MRKGRPLPMMNPMISSSVDVDVQDVVSFFLGTCIGLLVVLHALTRRPQSPSKSSNTETSTSISRLSRTVATAGQDEAEFLNNFVMQIWPEVSEYVRNLVHNTVEPSIDRALPWVLKGKIHFPDVQIGAAVPDLGPLVVKRGKHEESIQLLLGIRLVSDVKIWLRAMGVAIGITRLKLIGELTVNFSPAMYSPPFFGGMEIYFCNPPTVDLRFAGAARLLSCPGIRNIVRNAVDSGIGNSMVLPHVIAVDMNDEDDTDLIDMQCPKPAGVLELKLFNATDLLPADYSLFRQPSSDPYVVIQFGCKKWTSPVVKKNLNPVWGENGNGLVTDWMVHSKEQVLTIKVFDEDYGPSDDLIGESKGLTLDQICGNEPVAIQLYDGQGQPKAGTIWVSGIFHEAVEEAVTPSERTISYVEAKLLEVRGLPEGGRFPYHIKVSSCGEEETSGWSSAKPGEQVAQALRDVCVRLHAKHYPEETIAAITNTDKQRVREFLYQSGGCESESVKASMKDSIKRRSATNPQFNQILRVPVPGKPPQGSQVCISLTDKKGENIGSYSVQLADLMAAKAMQIIGPFKLESTDASLEGRLKLINLT